MSIFKILRSSLVRIREPLEGFNQDQIYPLQAYSGGEDTEGDELDVLAVVLLRNDVSVIHW